MGEEERELGGGWEAGCRRLTSRGCGALSAGVLWSSRVAAGTERMGRGQLCCF